MKYRAKPQNKPTNKSIRVFLQIGGLTLLLAPALLAGVQATTWGLLAATGAAASYGVSFFYSRQKLGGLPPLVAPTAQLAMAALYLLPLSLIFEQPYTLALPSWPATGSLLALAVVNTALAFVRKILSDSRITTHLANESPGIKG